MLLLDYIILLIGLAAGWFLRSYLSEKGKNLATSEDIKSITEAVEKIRSDFKREEYRYQLTVSGLLKKRAEVIESHYKMIVDIEEAFQRVVDFAEWADQPKDKLRKEAGDLLYKFVREYKRNRIYFSDDLCLKIQGLVNLIYEKSMPYSIALTAKLEGDRLADDTKIWVKANEAFQKEIPAARQAIESEFRGLLGAHGEAQTNQ